MQSGDDVCQVELEQVPETVNEQQDGCNYVRNGYDARPEMQSGDQKARERPQQQLDKKESEDGDPAGIIRPGQIEPAPHDL